MPESITKNKAIDLGLEQPVDANKAIELGLEQPIAPDQAVELGLEEKGFLEKAQDIGYGVADWWQGFRGEQEELRSTRSAEDILANAGMDIASIPFIPGDILAGAVNASKEEKGYLNKMGATAKALGMTVGELAKFPLDMVNNLVVAARLNPFTNEKQVQKAQEEVARNPIFHVLGATGFGKGFKSAAEKPKVLDAPLRKPRLEEIEAKRIESETVPKIPIFNNKHRTGDALNLGEQLKGNKEGIRRLRFLEEKFSEEARSVDTKTMEGLNQQAELIHKKSLYREAAEVAEGVGGAADFVAKEVKPVPVPEGMEGLHFVDPTVQELGNIAQRVRKSISGEPTSEANAAMIEIARERTGDINKGAFEAQRFRDEIDVDIKKVIKNEPKRTRLKKVLAGKSLAEEVKEDLIYFIQKTGNPYKTGDTFEALSKRIPEGAKKIATTVRFHMDELWNMINKSEHINDLAYVQDYLTQMYTGGSKKKIKQVAGNLIRKFPYAKKRKYESYHQAVLEGGLTPRFTNVGQIVQYYENLASRVMANNKMVDQVKKLHTTDGKGIIYRFKDLPIDMQGEYVSLSHPVFRRLYATEGKVKGIKEVSSERKVNEFTQTETKKEFTDTKESRKETVEGGEVTGAELESGGPKAKMEGIVIESLENRGMSRGEAENFVLRLKGGKAEATLSKDTIMKVVEIVKDQTTTKETLKTITRDSILEKVVELEREKPRARLEENVWVHPEIEVPLRNVLDDGFNMHRSKTMSFLKAANGLAKKAMLTMSWFHHLALTESAIATGNWNVYKSRKRGKELIKRMDESVEAGIRSGLKIDATNDVHLNTVTRALDTWVRGSKQVPLINKGFRVLKWANTKWDKALWDNYHRMLKMDSYNKIYVSNLEKYKDKPEVTEKQIAREAANFVNDAFGGQNWDGYLNKRNFKKYEQVSQLLFLAPDWTLSNLKIASRGLAGFMNLGPKTVNRQARSYWYRAATMFSIVQQMAQYGFWQANLSDEEKKTHSPWMWDNPPDEKWNINTFTKDDKERWIMIKPLKQAREVLRYGTNFTEIVGNKLSPVVREIVEQFTSHSPGSGYPQPYAEMEFYESIPVRLKNMASKVLPLSLKGSSFAYALPKRSAMNFYKTNKLFTQALKGFAEGSDNPEGLIDFLNEIKLHSDDNNLDTKMIFTTAISTVRGMYYTEMFKALNTNNMVEVEKYAVAIARLQGDTKYVERSLKTKFDRLLKQNRLDIDKSEVRDRIKSAMRQIKQSRDRTLKPFIKDVKR